MHRVLTGKSAEPHILYDPLTDKLGQYFPFDRTGRALRNDGGRRSNRVGRVCIQIEFVGYAARPFTNYWKPGPNFRAMMSSIGSWRIPDRWPSGEPPAYPTERDERDRTIWYNRGGWYGHSQVPGNYHGDPGEVDVEAVWSAQRSPLGQWPAFPRRWPGYDRIGAGPGHDSRLNLLIKAALIAHGEFGRMGGTVTHQWDAKATERVEGFKRHRDIDEKGIGPRTWRALGRMKRDVPDFPGPERFRIGEATTDSLVGQSLLVLQGFRRPLRGVMTREWRREARNAVRAFQLSEPRLQGDPDGVWGPLTWRLAWTDAD